MRDKKLIGKHRGMFIDRSTQNFQFGDLPKLTDEQLDDFLQQLERKLEEA